MHHLDIIEKCRQNDRKAQVELYKTYCDAMYTVAKRYLRHDAEAEDAVQDAFIKAFTKLHLFSAEVTFGAWLKRIVINTCLDVLKQRKKELINLDETHLKVVDNSLDDEWRITDEYSIETIVKTVNDLSEKYAIILKLFLFEGFDHQEISGILNITETSSRTLVFRGKQKLKALLKTPQHATGY